MSWHSLVTHTRGFANKALGRDSVKQKEEKWEFEVGMFYLMLL